MALWFALGPAPGLGGQPRPAVTAELKFTITIGYLSRDYPEPLPLSLIEPVLTDSGVQGARLALSEIRTTGHILGNGYEMLENVVRRDGDVAVEAKAMLSNGIRMVVANLEPDDILKIADLPEASEAIIVNARSSDDDLRGINCRHNVFHTAPSWAMRADAISQYMTWKSWKSWFLIHGTKPQDLAYAAALRRSAKKFGNRIAEERTFTFDAGNRRTDTGHQQIQSQIPKLTQSPPEHDIVIVADSEEAFGEFLQWRTTAAKPVAGTHGLVAVSWHRSFEQFGGTQLQNRFEAMAKRTMTERDYMAWLGVRAFGEAVTRTQSSEVQVLRAYLLGGDFELAGFKGQGMTFRTWDRQLRQPILLSGPRSLVSMSPQDGFLHQKFLTDTLGIDEPESKCGQKG
ncbi:MAG: ABC transporter substrate-binding protein [Hyphomicrobium sp.]